MIFISHKFNPDHERALEFKKIFDSLGINSWIAPECVTAGKCYAEEIPYALHKCEKVLLILTKEAMSSKHILKELDLAYRYNKEIIPVQFGDFPLSIEFEYLLSAVQTKKWDETTKEGIIGQLVSVSRTYEIEIQKSPTRKLVLMRGDFQDNINHAINNHLININKTVIAIGIDRTGDLSISSTKGILKDLCKYFYETFGYDISELQQFVNEAKKEQLNHSQKDQLMEFGDSILVKIPISNSELKEESYLNFLFIANSQKTESFSHTKDLDDINGIDSREIILKIFNRCIELNDKAETLFIGAMGTNGLSFPYEVIVSEIMNAFVYSAKLNKSPFNLFFSLRNVDMERAGVTSQSIYNYIRNVITFFN